MNYEQLMKFGVDQGASVIHLQADSPPQLRIGGLIRGVDGPRIKPDELRAFTASIAPKSVADDLDRAFAVGSAFSAATAAGRFGCSMYSHIGGPGLVLRVIPSKILSIEELNLPPAVRELALARRGLVLIVGPGGSGKSATMAAMVDLINATAYQKIVTVEAPVEYLLASKKAMVTQMEVGLNAASFEQGIEIASQQDADVIVVGELHGATVARMVMAAAEAGRKVLAAMTGRGVIQAIERFIALIPKDEREAAIALLGAELEGVIAQQLAKTREGKFRPAVEVFRGGVQTSKAIQENRLKDLTFFIEGRRGGMQSLDQHLIELHATGVISGTEAMRLATNPEAVGEGLRAARQVTSAAGPATLSP
jgi:twitching motility protein PilT